MKIGTELLHLRKRLGLTQAEMSAGVISTSFYSKVERNIHDIGVNDLIEILNKHKVDKVYFFRNLGTNEKKTEENILDQITLAFEQKNKGQLLKLKNKLEALPNSRQNEYYKLQLRLNLEVYLPKAKEIPSELKYKLKEYVFLNDSWDINSLQIFRETMRIYDIDELSFLVEAILTKYPNPNLLQGALQECIGAICINFLDNCYEKNAVKLTQRVIDYLFKMKSRKNLTLVKILGSYYNFIFKNNSKACQQIITVLNYAGYFDLVRVLPRI